MRKIILVSIFILSLAAPSFAQSNQTDTFIITTYYPAPHGVYGTMRLYPLSKPKVTCSQSFEGAMYYNAVNKTIEFCKCLDSGTCTQYSQYQWLPIGGGGWTESENKLATSKNLDVGGDVCLANGICLSQLTFNGQCGSASKTYPYTVISYGTDNFCSSGTPTPASPAFPVSGSSTTWTCPSGSGGTTPINCSASKDPCPTCYADSGGVCTAVTNYNEGNNCNSLCRGCVQGSCADIPEGMEDVGPATVCTGHSRCTPSLTCTTPITSEYCCGSVSSCSYTTQCDPVCAATGGWLTRYTYNPDTRVCTCYGQKYVY